MQQAQLRCLRQEMREAERGGEVAPTPTLRGSF
jgi:hypothetical protein